MRILISTPSMQGFGVDFITTVVDKLTERGHHIDVIQFAKTASSDQLNVTTVPVNRTIDKLLGYNLTTNGRWIFNWLLYRRWRRAVRQQLSEKEYDIVVSDRICSAPSTLAAQDSGVPAIIITTGPAAVRYDATNDKLDKTPHLSSLSTLKKFQYPFIKNVHRWNTAAFESVEEVVAVSDFDASITRHTFGRQPEIIFLPVRLQDFKATDHDPSKITMVNPRTENKGLNTFLAVAEQLPNVEFQVAGSLYDDAIESKIAKLDNVTFLGWCDEMREVYQNTKILLIPSQYEEGGPRIIAEAFVNGIPVIGSDLGGIPDYVGDGGKLIVDYDLVKPWVEAVERFADDNEYYQRKSAIARERSQLFELADRIDEFETVLECASGVQADSAR